MSREIKFRCWRGGYMCSYYPQWRFLENGLYWEEKDADPDKIDENKQPILLQYTGMKDKNGVEIYEGDICQVYSANYDKPGNECETIIEKDFIDFVKFDLGQYKFIDGPLCINTTEYPSQNLDLTKVIGNIYENPDLLERSN